MTICQCDGLIMAALLKIIGFYCHNRDNSKALWHHGKDGGDGGKDKESDRHRYGQDKKMKAATIPIVAAPGLLFLNQRYIMKQQII